MRTVARAGVSAFHHAARRSSSGVGALRLALIALGAFFFATGCQDVLAKDVGGETHFLKTCSDDEGTDACGAGLECLCGVCTVRCDESAPCSAHAGAACVEADTACQTNGPSRVCDVSCVEDGDCAGLSSAHSCIEGHCRAVLVGSPSAADALACEPARVDADQVLVIGDNMFAGPRPVLVPLEAAARTAGRLSQTEGFRDNSSATNNALAYMGHGIGAQYAAGNPDGTVRLVIMNGGGVDAVFGTCEVASADCPPLASAAVAAEELLRDMANDGVTGVLYSFYPDPANAGQKERLDVLRPLILSACEEAPVECYLLDLRPVFAGRYDGYVVPDGLTSEGSEATALAIWERVEHCLAP
jgi:hypothetical protein